MTVVCYATQNQRAASNTQVRTGPTTGEWSTVLRARCRCGGAISVLAPMAVDESPTITQMLFRPRRECCAPNIALSCARTSTNSPNTLST